MSDGKVKTAKLVGSEPHDVVSLLSASGRDLLVRNKGDQIKLRPTMNSLQKVILGLYLSPLMKTMSHSKGTSRRCHGLQSRSLIQKHAIVWMSCSKLERYPHLVILGEDGKVLSDRNESQSPGFVSQAHKPRDQSPDSLPPAQTLGVDAPPFVLSLLLVVAFLSQAFIQTPAGRSRLVLFLLLRLL
ncbi:hypothetical protein ACFX2J_037384 [Malus domestica]